jgi:uroporphyrin-III C-methyltransferase
MKRRDGKVLLVGAGPGAADLLTLRAVRAIEAADIVLYDALVGDDIRALIPPTARAVEVGKRGHRVATPQDFINRLMATLARQGACVVRLKGGDPSIYGRAAEERAFLESRGIQVEVIPGVTTATAAAAQFGFALTERESARRVLLATGRTLHGPQTDWTSAADKETTLCLYMGCADIEEIAARLIDAGRAAETPAIAAINVERPGAQLVTATLATLPVALASFERDAPVFIAIGEACAAAMASAPSFRRALS